MKKRVGLVFIVLALVWGGIGSKEAGSQGGEVEDFYRGATLRFIVPYEAASDRGVWALALAPYLEKHTGAKVVVENMAGGSAPRGIDYISHSVKPDGLSICVAGMAGVVVGHILGLPQAAKSDIEKLNYLARLDVTARAVYASKASGFRSIADMQRGNPPVRFTSTGGTADSAVDSALISEGFGLNAKIVAGSAGAAEDLVLLAQGKANAKCSTFSADYRELMEKGDLNLILFLGSKGSPDYPKVPIALEAPGIKPDKKKYVHLDTDLAGVGLMIMTSPGVPEERVLFLEKALSASLKDPGLLDWAKQKRANISHLSGRECKELIVRMGKLVPPAERTEFKHIIFEKYY